MCSSVPLLLWSVQMFCLYLRSGTEGHWSRPAHLVSFPGFGLGLRGLPCTLRTSVNTVNIQLLKTTFFVIFSIVVGIWYFTDEISLGGGHSVPKWFIDCFLDFRTMQSTHFLLQIPWVCGLIKVILIVSIVLLNRHPHSFWINPLFEGELVFKSI